MAAKVPTVVVVFAAIVAALYLISAMGLLSSIIAWLSLEFTAGLPAALAFSIGILSLGASFLSILMVGIAQFRRNLGFIFLIVAVVIILVGVGLLVPFALSYIGGGEDIIGDTCDECELLGMATDTCVRMCDDECCFTDMSGPLVIVFVAFTATSLVSSVIGIGVAVTHLYFVLRQGSHIRKQR